MSGYNYDELPEVKGEIIGWEEVGQKICGTYVGKSEMIDTKYGPKFLYEFQDDEGNIKKCWQRPNIDNVMKLFTPGVRVKIEYIASHPSKKGSNFKEIKVFGNSKNMNEEWLKSQENALEKIEEQSAAEPEETIKIEDVKEPEKTTDQPFHTVAEKEEMLKAIIDLAEKKLGTKTAEEAKEKVMEITKLAFIDANLLKLIEHLEDLPDRK